MPVRRLSVERVAVSVRMQALATAAALVVAVTGGSTAACVATQPATDTSTPVSPSGSSSPPSGTSAGPLAYNPDMVPIFASDCVPCHTGSRPLGGYSMANYTAVMRDVTPGSARSVLVTKTQSGGSMYRYFSVDRAGRADMVRRWVVDDQAAATR